MNLYLETMFWMLMSSIGEGLSQIRDHPLLFTWTLVYGSLLGFMLIRDRGEATMAFGYACIPAGVMSFVNICVAFVIVVQPWPLDLHPSQIGFDPTTPSWTILVLALTGLALYCWSIDRITGLVKRS